MSYQNCPIKVDESPGNKLYCTCGESGNKPYCDGSHATASTEKTPVKVEIEEAKEILICDCGTTGASPFCDGSHSRKTAGVFS